MSEFTTLLIIYFLLLAVVTTSAALVSRTEGKSSILVTGAAAWILMTLWIPVLLSGPGPLTFGHFGIFGLFLGFALSLALAPLYFFGNERSPGKNVLWGVAGAGITAPVVFFLGTGISIPYRHPCNLPTLTSDLHFESLVDVSASSFFSDECPLPINRKSRILRHWGVVQLEWHVHSLWMKATSSAGSDLSVKGEGIIRTESNFLGERYTALKPFEGQKFVDADVKTDLVVEVWGSNDEWQDKLKFTYDTVKCTCVVYDGL